jgi:hypothetical protein
MQKLKVLVGCEFSGVVRDAFAARGHDAWSCDLLPTEKPGNHIQGDVLEILGDGWDLMIAHPPCTVLSYAATKYWHQPGRAEKRKEAMKFFMACFNAPIQKVCVENPLGVPNTEFRKPDQIIEPFYFGESQRKRTCLWLRGLPQLIHCREDELFWSKTHTAPPLATYTDKSGNRRYFTDSNHGGHARSKSFQSIADAMASQWG